ncbi:allophanate hydrolase subunit 1 [Nocardioides anomalus]|uniref:Allophanate hydrolase subunit 1 n=1 Tax=Nocardioides anomalus TaxID=2712223 RepID=A0A6G6WCA1_9ACTN|nr:allophanate hydrolase subunit 1 [Nocardioides anomalus]QIG42670.1 allophanate hydrolase subunit 1 [Nocardioides anomalus]
MTTLPTGPAIGGGAEVELRPCGRDAVLAEVADSAAARSLAAHVRASGVAVTEVVPGARTVLLDGVGDRERLDGVLRSWRPDVGEIAGELVEVPVVYDGADLADVAARWGTDEEGVVARHTATEFVSAFCGFAPGFAYLAGLPEADAVPRLASPRPRVPAGAVALAGTWCGVYPSASPGGWRLLGRTDLVLWDPDRDPPALLAPGTRVRFRAV